MDFRISDIVIVFVGISLLLLTILIIVLITGRKGDVSKGKKSAVIVLTILTSIFIVLTPLVYQNIIPLALHVGYFIEVNDFNGDGKINGYKITMEGEAAYYEDMDAYGARGQKQDKGKYYINSSYVTIHFEKIEDVTFEIEGFGRRLCVDGEPAYVWFKDIEMKGF